MREYPEWLIRAAEGLEIPDGVERLFRYEMELHDMDIDDIDVWSWGDGGLLVIHDYMDNTTFMADSKQWDIGVEMADDAIDADEMWGIIYDYIAISESPDFPHYPRKAPRTSSV